MSELATEISSREGSTAEVLRDYESLRERYRDLRREDARLARLLLDYGDLKARLGFRGDAVALWEQGLELMRGHVASHGVLEMQRYPELLSLYVPGTQLMATLLVRVGRARMSERDLDASKSLLSEAMDVLRKRRN